MVGMMVGMKDVLSVALMVHSLVVVKAILTGEYLAV